jgi:hypothetical protein
MTGNRTQKSIQAEQNFPREGAKCGMHTIEQQKETYDPDVIKMVSTSPSPTSPISESVQQGIADVPPVIPIIGTTPSPIWRLRWLPRPWRIALLFLIFLLISNFVLDALGWNAAVESDTWGALKQITACEQQGKSPDVVVIGSSRAEAGIAPTVLSNALTSVLHHQTTVCNMAVTTSIPLQDYLELRKLYADGIRPRMILYATSDYALNNPTALHMPPVQMNVKYLANASDIPMLSQSDLFNSKENGVPWYLDFLAMQTVRAYADRQGLQIDLCRIIPNVGPCPTINPPAQKAVTSAIHQDEVHGWYPLPALTDRSIANSRAQYLEWLRDFHVSPTALDYMGRLVDLARQYGSSVVLLNTPILPMHLTFFPKPTDYLTYINALHIFAQEHDIPFYDTGLGYFSDQSDFADTNHLNYWGALKFSAWLGSNVIIPEYQRQVSGI